MWVVCMVPAAVAGDPAQSGLTPLGSFIRRYGTDHDGRLGITERRAAFVRKP